ncbi:MAG: hypothetical protein KC502_22505 [Myxococcales bacterium]|nr:hypothetical protein [Myxococcales bacterium]
MRAPILTHRQTQPAARSAAIAHPFSLTANVSVRRDNWRHWLAVWLMLALAGCGQTEDSAKPALTPDTVKHEDAGASVDAGAAVDADASVQDVTAADSAAYDAGTGDSPDTALPPDVQDTGDALLDTEPHDSASGGALDAGINGEVGVGPDGDAIPGATDGWNGDVVSAADSVGTVDGAGKVDSTGTVDGAGKTDGAGAVDSAGTVDGAGAVDGGAATDGSIIKPISKGPVDKGLKLNKYVVKSGGEVFYCQYLPPDGTERFIKAVTFKASGGIHHLRAVRFNDTKGKKAFGPEVCKYDLSHVPYEKGWVSQGEMPGSPGNEFQFHFPPGVAMQLGPKHGMLFEMHVLNAKAKPLSFEALYQLHTMKKSEVKQLAGLMLNFNQNLYYPPMKTTKNSRTCYASQDMWLSYGFGHMHAHGILFEAFHNNKLIYQTKEHIDAPHIQFPGNGHFVKKGDAITWACTVKNTLKTALTTGSSDITNEMCGFVAFYHPAKDSKTLFDCGQVTPPGRGGGP